MGRNQVWKKRIISKREEARPATAMILHHGPSIQSPTPAATRDPAAMTAKRMARLRWLPTNEDWLASNATLASFVTGTAQIARWTPLWAGRPGVSRFERLEAGVIHVGSPCPLGNCRGPGS